MIYRLRRLAQSSHDLQVSKTRKTPFTGAHGYVPIEKYVHRTSAVKSLLENGSVLPVQDQAHVWSVLLQRRQAQRLRPFRADKRARAYQHSVGHSRDPSSRHIEEQL